MIKPEDLAICRRRGHDVSPLSEDLWTRCKWCGMWVRVVSTVEEREDEPPAHEQSPLSRMERREKEAGR
jgi:hypothetical protein